MSELKQMFSYGLNFSIKRYILVSLCIFQCSVYANTELLTLPNDLLSKAKTEGRVKVIVNIKDVGDLSNDSTKQLATRIALHQSVRGKIKF